MSVVSVLVATPCARQSNMQLVYRWRATDWTWDSPEQKQAAERSGAYDPERAVPFSVEVAGHRLFLSYGSFQTGSPATLGTVPRSPQGTESPLLSPYPSWKWQYPVTTASRDCKRTLVNVLRSTADKCNRLWVLDIGAYAAFEAANGSAPACPAKLVVFDLSTDKPVRTYRLPDDQQNSGALLTSIAVDTSSGCEEAYAYWTDAHEQTITTYRWRDESSWVFRNDRFAPSPPNSSAGTLYVAGAHIPANDGVYQVVLPSQKAPARIWKDTAFWHVLTNYKENVVPISVLRDPRAASRPNNPHFRTLGCRGRWLGQEVVGAVSDCGVLLYTLAARDAVACWNTRLPYSRHTQAVVSHARPGALYPGGLSIVPGLRDPEQQEVWLLSSGSLRVIAAYQAQYPQIKFRPEDDKVFVYRASVRHLVRNSICE